MASTAGAEAQSESQDEHTASSSSQLNIGRATLSLKGESVPLPLKELRKAGLNQKHEVLFAAWDSNNDGIVDFSELASGLRKLSPERTELADAANDAIAALVEFDISQNRRLDKDEFRSFVDQLAHSMGSTFEAVAELLMVTALVAHPEDAAVSSSLLNYQGKAEKQVKQAQHANALLDDPHIERLFIVFDRDGKGEIDFKNLILMLKKLRPGVARDDIRAAAVNAMLLFDSNSNRSLDRKEFARFIQRLGLLMQRDCGALAQDLLGLAEQPDSPWEDESSSAGAPETSDVTSQIYETLADRKLHLLFELWDKDGDGHISFAELALGLRKFSAPDESVVVTAADAAEALVVFDVDSDQKLDRADFARFVNQFCSACGADFHTLSEFLILLAALEDNPGEELAFLLSEDKVNRAVLDLDQKWRISQQSDGSSQPGRTDESPPSQPGKTGRSPSRQTENESEQPAAAAHGDAVAVAAESSLYASEGSAGPGSSVVRSEPSAEISGGQPVASSRQPGSVRASVPEDTVPLDGTASASAESKGSSRDSGSRRQSHDGKAKQRRPSVTRARELEAKSDHPPRVIASQE